MDVGLLFPLVLTAIGVILVGTVVVVAGCHRFARR